MCEVLFVFLLFFPACFYLSLQKSLFVSLRTITDVIAVVRPVNELNLIDLMDEAKEEILRANSSAARFKESQRARSRLLFEYLRRMAFNSLVIVLWARAEKQKLEGPGMPEDVATAKTIGDVIESGTVFRIYAALALAKLSWWILLDGFRLWQARSLATLLYVASIDGLGEYRRLLNAVSVLAAGQGSEAQERLLALLRGGVVS